MSMFHHRRLFGVMALILFLMLFVQGCLQTSRIHTDPPGAQVSLNGAPLGETPVFYSSRAGIPKTYFIEISKPGYKSVETKVESSYRADVSLALLLPGIVPYFFSARLEDEYKYTLVPERKSSQR